MIINNIKILTSYLFTILITFVILFILNRLYVGSMMNLNSLPIKIIFILLYISIFYTAGKMISIYQKPRHDFTSFILVFFIGLVTIVISVLGGSGFNIYENINILALPAQIFLSPFVIISSIIGIKINLMTFIVESLFISLIIGISAKRKRQKYKFKRR